VPLLRLVGNFVRVRSPMDKHGLEVDWSLSCRRWMPTAISIFAVVAKQLFGKVCIRRNSQNLTLPMGNYESVAFVTTQRT
jgi:hypothetical protein